MKTSKRMLTLTIAATMTTSLAACVRVTVDPIHVVMDVNLRVDKQLDSFFAFENTAPTTQPVPTNTTKSPAA